MSTTMSLSARLHGASAAPAARSNPFLKGSRRAASGKGPLPERQQRQRCAPRVAVRAAATSKVSNNEESRARINDIIDVKSQTPMSQFELPGETDERALLDASSFPIAPTELIFKCKQFLAAAQGTRDPTLLADNFRFVAPVVGPLDKKTFVESVRSFKIEEAFPDFDPGYHHFRVDPYEPNRVWFTARGKGTNTGTLAGFVPPTGKVVETPPQCCSCTFNEFGLVIKYTIGYVMDKEVGNTGGLGGIYGLVYAIQPALLPFPEAQPWQPSLPYQIFQQTGGVLSTVASFISGRGADR